MENRYDHIKNANSLLGKLKSEQINCQNQLKNVHIQIFDNKLKISQIKKNRKIKSNYNIKEEIRLNILKWLFIIGYANLLISIIICVICHYPMVFLLGAIITTIGTSIGATIETINNNNIIKNLETDVNKEFEIENSNIDLFEKKDILENKIRQIQDNYNKYSKILSPYTKENGIDLDTTFEKIVIELTNYIENNYQSSTKTNNQTDNYCNLEETNDSFDFENKKDKSLNLSLSNPK